MFRERLGPQVSQRVLWKWIFLAFLAGQINAGGFLATGRFVSHMTGFATLFGVEFGNGSLVRALGMITVPIFFIMGVMISGYLVEMRILKERRPRFDIVMSLVTACLFISAVGGALDWLGPFGKALHLRDDYILMALLCLACGLMNAAISSSSASTVRVTHITGITTDMGLGWVRWFAKRRMPNADPVELKREKMMAEFRLGVMIAFAVGSAAGTWFFLQYRYLGFLLPTVCSLYALREAQRAYKDRLSYMV